MIRVLIACEYSGAVRQAFQSRGYEAWSCDLLPANDNSPFHIQGDAVPLLQDNWDLLIAHPPCTRLCNSGVRWLHERNLWNDMRAAADLFNRFLNAPIPLIAVENPVMHRYGREIVGRSPDFTIQPWQFGHGEVKRTCFWTRGLPKLKPTKIVEGRTPRVHHASPGKDRWKERSKTLDGIAAAIAHQWGPVAEAFAKSRRIAA